MLIPIRCRLTRAFSPPFGDILRPPIERTSTAYRSLRLQVVSLNASFLRFQKEPVVEHTAKLDWLSGILKEKAESTKERLARVWEAASNVAADKTKQATEQTTARTWAAATKDSANSIKQWIDGRASEAKQWFSYKASAPKTKVEHAKETAKDSLKYAEKVAEESLEHAHESIDYAKEYAKESIDYAKEEAKESIDYAKEEAKDSYEHAKERVKDSYDHAKEEAKDSYEHAKEQAKDSYDHAKEQAKDSFEHAKDHATDTATSWIGSIKSWFGYKASSLGHVKDSARQTAKDSIDYAKETAEDTIDYAKQKAKDAKHAAKDSYDHAKEYAEDTSKHARQTAKERAQKTIKRAEDSIDANKDRIVHETKNVVSWFGKLKSWVSSWFVSKAKAAKRISKEAICTVDDNVASLNNATMYAAVCLVERLEDAKEEATEKAKETAGATMDYIERSAESARDRVVQSYQDGKTKVHQAAEAIEQGKAKVKNWAAEEAEEAAETLLETREKVESYAQYANWRISGWLSTIWNKLSAVSPFKSSARSTGATMRGTAESARECVVDSYYDATGKIKDWARSAPAEAKGYMGWARESARDRVMHSFLDAKGKVEDWGAQGAHKAREAMDKIEGFAEEAVDEAKDYLKQTGEPVREAIDETKDFIWQTGESARERVVDSYYGATGKIKDWARSAPAKAKGYMGWARESARDRVMHSFLDAKGKVEDWARSAPAEAKGYMGWARESARDRVIHSYRDVFQQQQHYIVAAPVGECDTYDEMFWQTKDRIAHHDISKRQTRDRVRDSMAMFYREPESQWQTRDKVAAYATERLETRIKVRSLEQYMPVQARLQTRDKVRLMAQETSAESRVQTLDDFIDYVAGQFEAFLEGSRSALHTQSEIDKLFSLPLGQLFERPISIVHHHHHETWVDDSCEVITEINIGYLFAKVFGHQVDEDSELCQAVCMPIKEEEEEKPKPVRGIFFFFLLFLT